LLIFNSHFPVTTLGLDLLPGTYLNKFSVRAVLSDKTAQSSVGATLPEDRDRAGFWNVILL